MVDGLIDLLRDWLAALDRPRLHLLRRGGRTIPMRGAVRRGIRQAYRRARSSLPIGDMDFVVQMLPPLTIPQIGIGGYSPAADLSYIYLDPANPRFRQAVREDLAPLTAHELMHCARWRGPGYGTTLGEALVSEGLALHFESELRRQPPFYAVALAETDLARLEAAARAEWDGAAYDHRRWFGESGGPDIPPFGGYSLGYRIVGRKLAAWGLTASQAWDRPASDF